MARGGGYHRTANEHMLHSNTRANKARLHFAMLLLCLALKALLWQSWASAMPAAAVAWRVDVGGAVYSSPVFSPTGDLYVSSYDGYLYSVTANGLRTWRIFLGPLYYSPFVVQDEISESFTILAGYSMGGEGLGVVARVSSEGQLVSRDSFAVGSLQCAPQYLPGTSLSCNDGGDVVALSGDGRGQMWSADAHGGGVLSNIVVLSNVLEGMLCVGGAARHIACLDVNGSVVWNTTGGGSSSDFVTLLSAAQGGSALISGAFSCRLHVFAFIRPQLMPPSYLPVAPSHLLPSILLWPRHFSLKHQR
jgi:outer membrane protein assembly factor BamB